jgi:hypothetical protein
VAAPGVLANDQSMIGRSAVLDSAASHGAVTLNANGSYRYLPDPGFTGADQFVYHEAVASLLLASNPAIVRITVTNGAPTAVNDSYSATTAVTLSVAADGVLGNDADPDADSLVASLVDGSGNGSLALSPNGSFTFTSGGSFSGTRTFTYRVTDGIAWSNVATVSIVVKTQPVPTAAPTPTPAPTPTATPTAMPTPAPPLPVPSLSVPSLPVPTIPLPSIPADGAPSPAPTAASSTPVSTGSATPTPISSAAVPTVTSNPAASGDGAGSGPPTGLGSAGGSDGGSSGGGGAGVGPPFIVGGGDRSPLDGFGPLGLIALGGSFQWAVPSVVLSVPGLLVLIAVAAQTLGGLAWLPLLRRWLGGSRSRQGPRRPERGAST